MPRYKDFTGKNMFGLQVESYAGKSYWNCTCKCGNKMQVRAYELKRGLITECIECARKAKIKDISGQIFGRWKVIKYVGNKQWECECLECGKLSKVYKQNLLSGRSNSCQECSNRLKSTDISGNVYGSLEVIKYLRSNKGRQTYQCKCLKCGRLVEVDKNNLVSGNSTQCDDCRKAALITDMQGKQINSWYVDLYAGNGYWNCTCSCGTQHKVHGYNLRSGHSKSCGHDILIDLTDREFGEWKVLGYAGNSYWRCRCSCGTIANVHSYELRNGFTKSCGCKKHSKIQALESKDNLKNFIHKIGYKPSSYELGQLLGINVYNVLRNIHKFGLEDEIDMFPSVSRYEKEIVEYIKNLGITDVEVSNRGILGHNRELDIYIPSKSLAIEFNGTYWHNSNIKKRNYHQDKTLECDSKGIRLMHIFEYEWLNNDTRKKIEILLNKELSGADKVVYGRNTVVKDIDISIAKQFCEENHLQGYIRSIVNLGIFDTSDNLLGVMTFGFPRFDQGYQYEILRLCFKNNVEVIGGTEKLFKYFLNNYTPESVVSYCNIAKFSGKVYKRIGFKLDHISSPNYVWVKPSENDVLSKYKTQKSRLLEMGIGEEHQTEDEIMENMGYLKVYDAGNKVFVYHA